jgi:hypothetical protein
VSDSRSLTLGYDKWWFNQINLNVLIMNIDNQWGNRAKLVASGYLFCVIVHSRLFFLSTKKKKERKRKKKFNSSISLLRFLNKFEQIISILGTLPKKKKKYCVYITMQLKFLKTFSFIQPLANISLESALHNEISFSRVAAYLVLLTSLISYFIFLPFSFSSLYCYHFGAEYTNFYSHEIAL